MTKSFAMETFHLFLYFWFLKSKCGGIFYFFPLKILVDFKLSFPSSISFSPFIYKKLKNELFLRFFFILCICLIYFHCIFFSLSLFFVNTYVWGFLATKKNSMLRIHYTFAVISWYIWMNNSINGCKFLSSIFFALHSSLN